jgi:hypothetical protein
MWIRGRGGRVGVAGAVVVARVVGGVLRGKTGEVGRPGVGKGLVALLYSLSKEMVARRPLPMPPRGEEAVVADTDDDGLLFEIVLELEADIVAGFKVGGQEKLVAIRITQRGGSKCCQCCPTDMED